MRLKALWVLLDRQDDERSWVMFRWLLGGAKRRLRKEARGWNHTNAFNFMKPAQKPPRRSTALDACRAKVKRLEAIIKQKNNEIRQMKKINAAQQPMKDDQVNPGSYAYYQAGLKRILALTMKRQRLSTHTMPAIRAECNGMLGTNVEFHGWGRGDKPRTRAPK